MDAIEDFKAYLSHFQPLGNETWEAVQAIFRPVELKKGKWFAVGGEHANRFAFLRSGILRAYYQSVSGQDYNKSFFQAPTFVGAYSSLVTGDMNQIHIQALTNCTLLEADYGELNALYPGYQDLERLGRRFAESLFVAKEQRELDLVMLDARERYLKLQATHPISGIGNSAISYCLVPGRYAYAIEPGSSGFGGKMNGRSFY